MLDKSSFEECSLSVKKKSKKKKTQKHKSKEVKYMLGNFNGKLDKNTCLISLVVISLITLTVVSADLFNVFNISGVFKQ